MPSFALRFDRGTIVLTGAPGQAGLNAVSAGVNISHLPGVAITGVPDIDVTGLSGTSAAGAPHIVWDERVGLPRAAASERERVLAAFARRGIPVDDQVLAPASAAATSWCEPDLRPYQSAALAAWLAGGRRGIVALPTGAGKTRIAIAALAATRATALVLVPTRVLLAQWLAALRAALRGPLGALGDGERRVEGVTVATFESAARHMPAIGNRFQVLVVDEVHHFGRGTRDEPLLMSAAPWRLGLTATPPRDPQHVAGLAALVGPPVFTLTIAQLAGGFLAPFDVLTFLLRFTPEEAAAYRTDSARYRAVAGPFFRERDDRNQRADGGRPSGTGHAAWEAFRRHAATSPEGRAALAAWRRARALADFHTAKAEVAGTLLAAHRGARTLVFTGSNAAAYAIAAGQLVQPITCDIGRAERAEALAAFARGELRALVSSHVLDEGVDVPAAEVAIVVGGTGRDREYVQRVGRLLRPAEGKRAIVYHLVTRGTYEVPRARRLQRALLSPTAGATGRRGAPAAECMEKVAGEAPP